MTRVFGPSVLSQYPFLSTSISYYYLSETVIPEDRERTPIQTERHLLHTTLLKESHMILLTHTLPGHTVEMIARNSSKICHDSSRICPRFLILS